MANVSVLKTRLRKLWYLSWHSVLCLGRYFISSQNLVTQCVKIWAVQLLEFLYSFQKSLCSLCCFLPPLFFLILRKKFVYYGRGGGGERLLSSCCFLWKNKVLHTAWFNTWMFSVCLHARDKPAYCGSLHEGSAMPESRRDAAQRKLTCLCSLNPVPSQRWLIPLKSAERTDSFCLWKIITETENYSSSSGCW